MKALCKETTKKYIRLPPPQAVPFTGFSFAKIESREPIAEKLREFMKRTREANFFTTGLVIAEWGEGKTDAYERYIIPEAAKRGDYAYLVSTSTIVNKLSKADNIFPYGPPESVTLAACALFALRDELSLRNEDLSKFPPYQEYKEPSEYIEEVLTRHLSKGKKRIYLFIDEFEEILAQRSDVQKKFMSGLKELLNGQLKLVHEGGKFAGRLHFILACTPYAYNRIRSDVDLSQIFGALDQRLSSNRIYLPQIEKKEAIKFLIDVLKFCYENSLPQPLPIKSSGILNGICNISQRNLRSLVQLLSDLLSAAATDGKLYVVDFDQFLNTLKGKPISVYGASTQCIDKDLLPKIEFTLGNLSYGSDYVKIFRLLAGELKAFSIEEIQERVGVKDVPYRINEINQELRKMGISKAIARLDPLKENKKIEEVLELLNPVEDSILLGTARKISMGKFKDETIHYELSSTGEIHQRMFIPTDREELQKALDLYEEEADDLYSKLSRNFSSIGSKRHFMLSKELVDQMFPSPLVLQLDFILDRSKRMTLWREAMKGFLEKELELRDGLIEVLNKEDSLKITTESGNLILEYSMPSGIQTKIPLAIHSTTSRVTMSDAENLKELIKRERPGLVLLFHVGEIEENAHTELTVIPNILSIHIRPIRAQQLIALSLARKRDAKLNKIILDERLREILYELNFGQEFTKWLERCRREGLIIEDLKRPSGKSESSLAQAMTYYIQTIDEKPTLQKVFNESNRLQALTLFGRGKNPSFAPLDIETTEALNEYQKELCENGFLREEKEKVIICTTPVEERILKNLGKRALPIEEMKRRFIVLAQNKKILEQVYVPLLKAKGLVQVKKESLVPVSKEERERQIRQKIKEYDERLKEKRQEWWAFAHICISKKREDRIILLTEFDEIIKELSAKLDSPNVKYNEKNLLRVLRLVDDLLLYYEETLDPMIANALSRGRELYRYVIERKNKIDTALRSVLQFYNSFSERKYNETNVEDYIKLKNSFEEFMKIYKANYTKNQIEEGLAFIASVFEPRQRYEGAPRYFYYERDNDQASCFNYKIYKMEEAERAFSTRYKELDELIEKISEERSKFHMLGSGSRARLLKYTIDKRYMISSILHEALSSYQKTPIKPSPLKTLSLSDIYNFIEELYRTQEDFNSRINESLGILEELIEHERNILSAEEEIVNNAKKIAIFFDEGGQLLTEANATLSNIKEIMKNYEKKANDFQNFLATKPGINEINKNAKTIRNELLGLISSLEEEQKSLTTLCSKGIGILEDYQSGILRFLEVLRKGGVDAIMLSKPFKEVIGQAISDIEELKHGKNTKYTWKEILANLDDLKMKLYTEVKNILDKNQFDVLLAVVNASSKEKWFDLSILKKDLMNEFDMSENQITKIIDSLVRNQMLKQGVSLPI